MVAALDGLRRFGGDAEKFLGDLLELLRHVTVAASAGAERVDANLAESTRAAAAELSALREPLDLQRIFASLLGTAGDLRRGIDPYLVLEMGLLKVATLEPVASAAEILARLEAGAGRGGASGGASGGGPAGGGGSPAARPRSAAAPGASAGASAGAPARDAAPPARAATTPPAPTAGRNAPGTGSSAKPKSRFAAAFEAASAGVAGVAGVPGGSASDLEPPPPEDDDAPAPARNGQAVAAPPTETRPETAATPAAAATREAAATHAAPAKRATDAKPKAAAKPAAPARHATAATPETSAKHDAAANPEAPAVPRAPEPALDEPAAAAAGAAPGDSHDWELFLDAARAALGMNLYVALTNCRVTRMDSEGLTLEPLAEGFAQRLQNTAATKRIAELARNQFGPACELRIGSTVAGAPAADAGATAVTAQGLEDERTRRKQAEAVEDPLVQEAVRNLGGKVAKISLIDD